MKNFYVSLAVALGVVVLGSCTEKKKTEDGSHHVKYTIQQGNECYILSKTFNSEKDAQNEISKIDEKIKDNGNIDDIKKNLQEGQKKGWNASYNNNYESSKKSAKQYYKDVKNK